MPLHGHIHTLGLVLLVVKILVRAAGNILRIARNLFFELFVYFRSASRLKIIIHSVLTAKFLKIGSGFYRRCRRYEIRKSNAPKAARKHTLNTVNTGIYFFGELPFAPA